MSPWDDVGWEGTQARQPLSPRDFTTTELIRELEQREHVILEKKKLSLHSSKPHMFVDPRYKVGETLHPEVRVVEAFQLEAREVSYVMPDNSVLHVDHEGNYRIEDTHSRVVYKANRRREFNPYLNASDLLEDFIKFVGTLGVRQGEVLQVPITAFIHWLVFKAAERDGDDVSNFPSVKDVLPANLLALE